MDPDEVFLSILSLALGLWGAYRTRVSSLPTLFRRGNPGIGLCRLAVLLSMLWILFVLLFFADPSVVGIYVLQYLAVGYAAVKWFGQIGARVFGTRLRVDVYERKNEAAAWFIAGWTLATGLIFGGSLWGEADPSGEGEGGWWIPVGFFLLGWISLLVATALYHGREPGVFRDQIRRERRVEDGRAAAAFVLSAAVVLADAVAGDFFGWKHGCLSVASVFVMLAAHEVAKPRSGDLAQDPVRIWEATLYLLVGGGAWGLSRWLDFLAARAA